MRRGNFLTLIVLGLLVNGKNFAQQKNVENFLIPPKNFFAFLPKNSIKPGGQLPAFSLASTANKGTVFYRSSFHPGRPVIGRDYYVKHLGFFCRREMQLEKAVLIPLRFRLGSLAYTDYLEGKRVNYFR